MTIFISIIGFCLFWGGYWLGWKDALIQAEVDASFVKLDKLFEQVMHPERKI